MPAGEGRARRHGEARGGASAAVTGLVRRRVQRAARAARGRARRGRGPDRRRATPGSSARRAGTPPSRTGSSCTCFAASRAGSRRSRTWSDARWRSTRPTRSGAACWRRWRRSWATRPRRATRSTPRGRRLREPAVRRGVARQHGPARGDGDRSRRRRAAAVLYELLLPYGDRVAVSYPEISTGSVARNLGPPGGDDGALGRRRAALRGRARDQRADRRAALARAHPARLRAHARRSRGPGDRDRALELAGRAREGYSSLGMDSFAAGAERLTESLGTARAP